eukprot:PhM_4_TR3225/c0_g1_i1/m.45013
MQRELMEKVHPMDGDEPLRVLVHLDGQERLEVVGVHVQRVRVLEQQHVAVLHQIVEDDRREVHVGHPSAPQPELALHVAWGERPAPTEQPTQHVLRYRAARHLLVDVREALAHDRHNEVEEQEVRQNHVRPEVQPGEDGFRLLHGVVVEGAHHHADERAVRRVDGAELPHCWAEETEARDCIRRHHQHEEDDETDHVLLRLGKRSRQYVQTGVELRVLEDLYECNDCVDTVQIDLLRVQIQQSVEVLGVGREGQAARRRPGARPPHPVEDERRHQHGQVHELHDVPHARKEVEAAARPRGVVAPVPDELEPEHQTNR